MGPIDYRAKLLALREQAIIELDDSVLVGEDGNDNLWGSRCIAHCRLCNAKICDMTGYQRWAIYQGAGKAILGHEFVCEAEQLQLHV